MKKLFPFLALALGLLVVSCQPENQYSISGEISNAQDSTMIYLQKPEGRGLVNVDSTMLVGNKFEFKKDSVSTPHLVVLSYGAKKVFAQVFLSPTDINITANADSLHPMNATVEAAGGETKIFEDYMRETLVLTKELQKYQQEYQQASMMKNADKMEEIQVNFEALNDKLKAKATKFVKANSSSAVGTFVLFSQLARGLDYEKLNELMGELSGEATTTPAYAQLSQYLEGQKAQYEKSQTVAIGKMAPDFTVTTPEGDEIKLSDLRGKYVLLDFWASWCAPCRKENPNIVKAYNKFKGKNFDIFGVSLDKDKAAWLKAIDDDNLTWHHGSDLAGWQSGAAGKYAVQSIPASFLIDPEGKIIARDLRGEELHNKLAELLK